MYAIFTYCSCKGKRSDLVYAIFLMRMQNNGRVTCDQRLLMKEHPSLSQKNVPYSFQLMLNTQPFVNFITHFLYIIDRPQFIIFKYIYLFSLQLHNADIGTQVYFMFLLNNKAINFKN